jgi:hypothetical protein
MSSKHKMTPTVPAGLKAHAAAAYIQLLKEGFDKSSAHYLATHFPLERIQRQCALMAKRTVAKSRLGMLRKAIEEDWADPEAKTVKRKRVIAPRTSRTVWRAPDTPLPADELDEATARRKLARFELELESRWPELLLEFRLTEIEKRAEIERMQLVGPELIKTVLESFDDPRQKLDRIKKFVRLQDLEGNERKRGNQ